MPLLPGVGSQSPWLFEPNQTFLPPDPYGYAVRTTPDLAGYYRLDESSGLVMNATWGPNGTYQGSNQTYGITGLVNNTNLDLATQFQRVVAGGGGYGLVSDAPTYFDSGAGFTHECWVSPLSDTARSTSQNVLSRTNYGLFLTASNVPGIFHSGFTNTFATNPLVANSIYHLVYTFDGATHTVYQDSVSIISIGGTKTAGGALGVATYATPNGDEANVMMDEVSVYTSAISAADVLNHYTIGAGVLLSATTNHFLSVSGVGS